MDVFSIILLIGFIGACLLAARIGAAYRPGDWYGSEADIGRLIANVRLVPLADV